MKEVFVDNSGFYALLDRDDAFHRTARDCFECAEREGWRLWTTSYVLHETWALVQHRLGMEALEQLLEVLIPVCEVDYVDRALHALGALRCRTANHRRLSLTDCVSLEFMRLRGLTEAIAHDDHFTRAGVRLPS